MAKSEFQLTTKVSEKGGFFASIFSTSPTFCVGIEVILTAI